MRFLTLLLALLPALALAQDAPTLASLKDQNRVLLVFAPSDNDPLFQQQIGILQHHLSEMKDRDLVLIPVLVHVGSAAGPNTLRELHSPVASDADQLALRDRFHVPQDRFAVILVGKDGGEKLRQQRPISMEKLASTIDAMPMRQDEMRERKQ